MLDKIIVMDDQQTAIHDEIIQKIHEGYHLISYSLGMAMGKTYNAFNLMEELFPDKRVLYITPNTDIQEEIKRKDCFNNIENICQIDFVCYASFNKIDAKFYDYDVIFIDEMHHLASSIRGNNIRIIMKYYAKNGKYVFGFSATPDYNRVEGYVDTRKFFEWHVEGISTEEAIKEGLLPTPLYSVVHKKERLFKKKGIRKRVTTQSANDVLICKVKAHPEITKYIAYFPQSIDLLDNYVMMRKLFPEFKLFVTLSQNCRIMDIDRSGLDDYGHELFELIEKYKGRETEVIREMDQYEGKAIILNVGKLLEGSHPKTVNGIMFFRDTDNNIIFEQALGRALHKGSKIQPLFLDIAGAGDKVSKAIIEGRYERDFNSLNKSKNYEDIEYIVDDENVKRFINVMDIEADKFIDKDIPITGSMKAKRYRYIVYYNYIDLASRFGIAYTKLIDELTNTFNNDEQKLMDFYLDRNRKVIRNISFSSNEELARKLNKPLIFITRALARGLNYDDIIIKALG